MTRNPTPVPDRAEATELIARHMSDLTGTDIGSGDDFFACGGHSLSAMKLLGRLRRAGLDVGVDTILTHRTPEKIAAAVTVGADGGEGPVAHTQLPGEGVLVDFSGGDGAPLFCFHAVVGLAWSYAPLAGLLDGGHRVIGVQLPDAETTLSIGLDHDELCRYYLDLVRQVQPEGPYRLLGYSSGGALAHTIAGMLQQDGEVVDFLGVIDAYPSGIAPDTPNGLAAALDTFIRHHKPGEEIPALPGDGGFGDILAVLEHFDDALIGEMIRAANAPNFSEEEIESMKDASGRCFMIHMTATPSPYRGPVLVLRAGDTTDMAGLNWEPLKAWQDLDGVEPVTSHTVDSAHLAMSSVQAWESMAPVISRHLTH
ncbi:thioesterase domain-containing protein [Corynebacterium sp. P7202]|uniref:Thioesterase domain-containing protein n=1 Tax=Corynebacterium pygosceleis TaxID=2800406 RepID=A0A9Q4C9W5_9CORY|nr:thioesterase domain-containing protein [Corynebacterium pygosceleis]MCK7637521.1 thioesterase domain-containing protein [Corynebacterium pygosceleis]MCX7444950.1 thioesterase domain-containing protein [Corynebacterium pygosceleis]MCX7468150.1 thioesterase domain-containing protein [Corynebacterium pygosceleis]